MALTGAQPLIGGIGEAHADYFYFGRAFCPNRALLDRRKRRLPVSSVVGNRNKQNLNQ